MITFRLVRIKMTLLLLNDISAALNVACPAEKSVHLFKRNTLGLWDQEKYICDQNAVDTSEH